MCRLADPETRDEWVPKPGESRKMGSPYGSHLGSADNLMWHWNLKSGRSERNRREQAGPNPATGIHLQEDERTVYQVSYAHFISLRAHLARMVSQCTTLMRVASDDGKRRDWLRADAPNVVGAGRPN